MKLVVEIDEATYKDIKKGKVYSSFRDVPQESVLAIANGILFDGVLQEIRQEINEITDTMGVSYYPYISKVETLEIIDNHIKEDTE